MNLHPNELLVLHAIVVKALADSSQSLSQMTTGRIFLREPELSFQPLTLVPGITGRPAAVVTAVYLGMDGDLHGHLMLLFSVEGACRLVDLLMENPPGTCTALDEIGTSALAETGNICGSAFMNAISDRTGLKVIPTTPAVVTDMAGAILQSVVTELYLNGDEILVVETGFNGEVQGHLLLMPDTDSMARLVAALEMIG